MRDVSSAPGLAVWNMPDAHFTYLRAYSLAQLVIAEPLEITRISRTGGNVVLDISKPAGALYNVLRASVVSGPYAPVATNQSAPQYTEPAPAGNAFYRLELVP